MKLVVGLGNPGEKYAATRHNIGFMVVDHLAKDLGSQALVWENNQKYNAMLARVGDVILVKPQTFVNASGYAVKSLVGYYKLTPVDVWVIHDDLDLPLGKIRIREGGGSPGHHGVDSIIKELGSAGFVRFRLGIGRGKESTGPNADRKLNRNSVINFVISRFQRGEAGDFKHLIKRGSEAVKIGLLEGLDKAMNRFN